MPAADDTVSVLDPGTMGFGLHLPIAAQSQSFAQGWESGCGPEEMGRIAQVADECGFFYLAVSDHIAVPRGLAERMSTVWYDTVATLSWLSLIHI